MLKAQEKTILLVEDEAVTAMQEAAMLKRNGFLILIANDGAAAMKLFRENPGIDLVLMDIDLGDGIDGTRVAENILAEHEVPVLFLSSHTEPEVVDTTDRIASYGYVAKNSGNTVLLASIRTALRLFEARRNIPEPRSSEDELSEAQSLLKLSFEQIPMPMLLVAAGDYRILLSNPACRRLMGIPDDTSYIGKSLLEIPRNWQDLRPDGTPLPMEDLPIVRALRGIPTRNLDHLIRFKDGNERWVLVNCAPVHGRSGAVIGGLLSLNDITEQKRLIEKERENEARYRLLTDKMTDIVWTMDLSLRTTYVSPSIRKILGFSQEERMAQNPRDQLTPASYALASETLLKEFERDNSETGIERDRNLVLELEYYHRDGSIVWLENNMSWQRNEIGTIVGIHGVSRDITERKIAELNIQRKVELIEGISENMPGVLYQFFALDSGEMGLSYVSDGSKKIFGIDGNPSDYLPRFTEQIVPADREAFLSSIDAAVRAGSRWEFEGRFIKPDSGEEIFFQGLSQPSRHKDSLIFSGVLLDITQRKKSETALAGALAEKDALLRELQHRVKNSLAIIAGLVSFEADRLNDGGAKSSLENIRNRIISLSELYDMLFLTREITHIHIGHYIARLCASLMKSYDADMRRISLRIDADDTIINTKRAVSLGLIVNELITNSMKHAFPGGRPGLIRITFREQGTDAVLSVADDGVGLPSGFCEDPSKGLGLMIVKTLTTQLGGTGACGKGPGASISITFPLNE